MNWKRKASEVLPVGASTGNPTLDAWVDKLNALTTPEIYDMMVEHEVQGVPGIDTECPLANFLRCQGVDGVTVGRFTIADGTQRRSRRVRLDDGPCMFIRRFDYGMFPDLERRS